MLCSLCGNKKIVKKNSRKILQAKYFDALHDADLCIIMA